MNAKVTKKYGVSVALLEGAATVIQGGLHDPQVGAAVLARMGPTFRAEYDAALAGFVKAIGDQAVARGVVATGVVEQTKAVAGTARRTHSVRNLAKRNFAGQDALLHSDFTVGEADPKRLDAMIARAEKTHAGCVQHAAELEPRGWPASATSGLLVAITALKEARTAVQGAKAIRQSATGDVVARGNALYDLCRNVQIVAEEEYPIERAQAEPAVLEARGRFLLGVFPPRARGKREGTDAAPVAVANPGAAEAGKP